ncbi:ATP-binding cassette domain-containing protein [Microbacterium sp. NPDC019599]|uniref:ATP-binding cassette domain-containing protein n=1 Tax=Microbacterium sp. NPDC019599 TaxID=3154690 RepID=UPI0033E1E7F3
MTLRPGPLRAAAALAAGFVAVRVVYRVLFHGADGSGPVILALPEVRLPPPFAHVVLFGPVTTGGLWDAAASAVPIALTILAFGLLNALIDLPRVFARGSRRGPLRGIARTLAVAWGTLPALVDAVRSVRFAQRLRGERGGARLLAPVLERTLARATAVAAALELRGFAGTSVPGDCEAPVVVRDAELAHAGASSVVRIDDLRLAPGTLTVLAGATGSGKSTVLRALGGLLTHLDGGSITGTLEVVGHNRTAVAPRDTAQRVGVVLQQPRDAFATERVRDELGLALELRGVAPVLVRARVDEVAEAVGIRPLLERRLRGLSAGEATLVAIAAAIVERPILLLVDEPLADLDTDYRRRIVTLLGALAHDAGVCVVVAEHRAAEFAAVADRMLALEAGVLQESAVSDAPIRARRSTSLPGAEVLTVRGLTVRHGDGVAVEDADLALRSGEIVALLGPNGAGKSSLLAAMAVPDAVSDVFLDGARVARRGRGGAGAGIALVPDASDDLFVHETVAAECRRADRRAHEPVGTTLQRFADLLGLGAEVVARGEQHPLDLSSGERRCLALAVQLASSPRVLLVDEPTRGLDPRARQVVASALERLTEEGTAVLVATHDAEFAAAVADSILPLRNGRLGDPVPAGAGPSARPVLHNSARTDVAGVPSRVVLQAGSRRHLEVEELRTRRRLPARSTLALLAANVVALAAFAWPFAAMAVPAQAQAAVPFAALALAPLAVIVVLASLDGTVRSAHTLALLGILAAIGAAIRIVGTGVGGVEAVFILLILAGRVLGARFGLLLGVLTIALSSLMWGGIGPWTPFQMFACAWVGAGAGLLPRRLPRGGEIAMLIAYGVVASYAFGLIMNLWFWPFAVGTQTGISYEAGAALGQNLSSFLLYSLVTSTLTWDTLRAVTTTVGLLVVGRAVLASLRRAKPVAPAPPTGRTPSRSRADLMGASARSPRKETP